MPLQKWPGREPLQLCTFTRARIWTVGRRTGVGSLDGETPNDNAGPHSCAGPVSALDWILEELWWL